MKLVLLRKAYENNIPIAKAKGLNRNFLTPSYNYVKNFQVYILLPVESGKIKQEVVKMPKQSEGEAIVELIVVLVVLLAIPATALIIWSIIGAILTILAIAAILAVGVFLVWLFFIKDNSNYY